jgi:hypothetical protein
MLLSFEPLYLGLAILPFKVREHFGKINVLLPVCPVIGRDKSI